MTDLPKAHRHLRAGAWDGAADRLVLDHEARFLRRRALTAEGGLAFLADLPQTVGLEPGDALELEDGRRVEVAAAPEPLLRVRGDLARLAWHIGNRHTPCQVGEGWLAIRRDHVLRDMLVRLGAEVEETEGPFHPEGGAYGAGRTMGHDHGSSHGHGDGHGHGHGHAQGQGHGHEGGHVHHHASRHHLSEDDDDLPDEDL